jgi:hypothetical protein
MGRTSSAKRRTLLKKCPKQFERCKYYYQRCGFEPGTCKSTRKCGTIHFQIFKHIGVVLSIETDVQPVQINIALNR